MKDYIIDFLYSKGIAETIHYDNSTDFFKEIKDSKEVGRPFRSRILEKKKESSLEIERELQK